MSVEKAVVRAGTIHEMGVAMDDRLDAAKREQQQLLGQKQAFSAGAKMVAQLHAAVDHDVSAGKLDLTQAQLAKDWVTKAATVVQNLGLRADAQLLACGGKVEALEGVVAYHKARHVQETAKAQEPVEPPAPMQRQEGTHPGPPLKDQRLQEDNPPVAPAAQEEQAAAAPASTRKRVAPGKKRS